MHVLRPDEGPIPEFQRLARVRSELWWLDRVRADLGLHVPVPLRTPAGEGVVSVEGEGMSIPRLCTIFRWVDGRFVYDRLQPSHLEAVGQVTARLHTHSSTLQVPSDFDRPRVDQAIGEMEEGVVRLFADHFSVEAAGVMRRVFRRVRRAQEELGSIPETFGVIHADIHQKNYLFADGEVRLIDFGDCGWGHHLYDLAVTASELGGLPRRMELWAGFLAGYRRLRDLAPAHESLVADFVMLREVQNLAWFLQERDDPSYRGRRSQIEKGVASLARRLAGTEPEAAPFLGD